MADETTPSANEPEVESLVEAAPALDAPQTWFEQFIQALSAPDQSAGVVVGVLGTMSSPSESRSYACCGAG